MKQSELARQLRLETIKKTNALSCSQKEKEEVINEVNNLSDFDVINEIIEIHCNFYLDATTIKNITEYVDDMNEFFCVLSSYVADPKMRN